jgi:hypothetical protein
MVQGRSFKVEAIQFPCCSDVTSEPSLWISGLLGGWVLDIGMDRASFSGHLYGITKHCENRTYPQLVVQICNVMQMNLY